MIKKGFTDTNGQYYLYVEEHRLNKEGLMNIGIYKTQTTREADSIFVEDPMEFSVDGVMIYQSREKENLGFRIYQRFSEYNFNSLEDAVLINSLMQIQPNIKLTDFPTGVVTLEGRIIGQIIKYYDDYMTLYEKIKLLKNYDELFSIYYKIVAILDELTKNNIIYTDNHLKNFMINEKNDIKLIDFESKQINFQNNKSDKDNSLNNLMIMFNRINQLVGLDYRIESIENLDHAKEEIMIMRRKI